MALSPRKDLGGGDVSPLFVFFDLPKRALGFVRDASKRSRGLWVFGLCF